MKEFVVTENTNLKAFTDNVCAPASFCFRTLLKAREIRVNGKKTGENIRLIPGDRVQYFLTPAQENKTGFDIVYDDEFVTIVDKESGVNSEAVFSALSARGESYFIHRLDRNTAGLLIFAKTKEAAEELLRAFKERRVQKIYLARVIGKMPKSHAVEEAYLQKDEKNALVHVSQIPVGEKIITEYEVLLEEGETSLLKILLHTGKTHQIRAHLSFLRHPVVGDEKYGDSAFNRACHLTRQQLVSKELTLETCGVLSYLNGEIFRSAHTL